jgi:hypothetical protein
MKKIKITELSATGGNDHAVRKNEYSAAVQEVSLRRFTRFDCSAKLTIMHGTLIKNMNYISIRWSPSLLRKPASPV